MNEERISKERKNSGKSGFFKKNIDGDKESVESRKRFRLDESESFPPSRTFDGFKILDALSASGLRGLRFCKADYQ
jgi:tRNA G26 N,N-dimethylase Trm1